jgi:hypothetical protein
VGREADQECAGGKKWIKMQNKELVMMSGKGSLRRPRHRDEL